ncbi:MAG TPA: LTA synthase family protein [Oscillatoriaceae cyanobacterium]
MSESPRASDLFGPPLVALALFIKFFAFNHLISAGAANTATSTEATLAVLVFFTVWTYWLPGRFRFAALLVVDLLFSLVLFADMLYLRYFHDIFPVSAIFYSGQLVDVHGAVTSLIKPHDFAIFAELPLVVALWFIRGQSLRLRFKHGFVGATLLACVGLFAAAFVQVQHDYPNALSSSVVRVSCGQVIGALPYHLYRGYRLAVSRFHAPPSPQQVAAIAHWLAEKNPPAGPGLAHGDNVLIIQIEALQEFVIGRRINGQEITPNLNRFAPHCLLYRNLYGQTRGGNTVDAEFMTDTSNYPANSGAVFVNDAINTYDSLPGALVQRGYHTAVFHSNSPTFWNRNRMYPALHIQNFYSAGDFKQDDVVGLGLSDRSFLKQTLPRLEAFQQPFYARVITLSSHFPYNDAAHLGHLNVGNLAGTRIGNYLENINYTDAQLGTFLDALAKSRMWQHTVVVLYGDHPAIRQENRAALLRYLGEPNTDVAWQKQWKIPLFIHVPGDKLKGTPSITAGQMDVMPTIADLMGVRVETAFGQDLLRATHGFVVLAGGSFLTDKAYYDALNNRAYDLASEKPIPVATFATQRAEAQRSLDYASLVLQDDLVPALNREFERNGSSEELGRRRHSHHPGTRFARRGRGA